MGLSQRSPRTRKESTRGVLRPSQIGVQPNSAIRGASGSGKIGPMRFQAPRGTEDVLPGQAHLWTRLETAFRALCELYGYEELRTPTFEDTELFVRSSGETSEVVSKQMYTFIDRGGRSITLKPEGTAPAVRAAIEHGLIPPGTVRRLAYITPIFRYERPQKGRLREAHQVGIELIGSSSPSADAEVIEFTVDFYRRLGIGNVGVSLNSLGRSQCREAYRAALLAYAEPKLSGYDEEFRARARANPLRLLDTKDEELKALLSDAPRVLEFLEPDSSERFAKLQRLLDLAGIVFEVDSGIVRGLDYYTETVFEVKSEALGAQNALCGGGRYDDLVKELGGAPMPSVGVAMGIERALMAMEAAGVTKAAEPPAVFVVTASPEAAEAASRLARDLRGKGISCVTDPEGRSLKSQMNQANKSGARFAAILGEDEIGAGTVTLRELSTGHQETFPIAEAAERVGGVKS